MRELTFNDLNKEKVNNLIKYELIRKGFSIDNINNIISQKKDSIT